MLPDAVLAAPRQGLINVHASLLPKYRGAAPVHRAIMAGEQQTGITIIRLVREMDAGPMLASEARAIGPDETSDAVERDLAQIGAALLVRSVADLDAGRAREVAQDERGVTFAPRLTKQDGLIDWNEPASAVHNRVRGLHPWPHAYTFLGDARYVILHTAVSQGDEVPEPRTGLPCPTPGQVLEARGRSTHRGGRSRFRWVAIPAWLGGGNLADSAGRPPGSGDTRISGRSPDPAGVDLPFLTRTMIAPARWAAYRVLRAVNERRTDLPQALAHTRASLRDARDRALASEIATGTLRWQGTLDYLVARYARRPTARLDPEVLDILRLSIYQLVHLNRVPTAAAVHDAVDLARRAGKGSASGLVNAVLRAITRERQQLPLPEPPALTPSPDPPASDADVRLGGSRAAALDYLSITLSHPRWLVERWLDRHGFAIAAGWARFNNTPAPLTLRVNRLKIRAGDLVDALAAHAVTVQPTRYAPDGLVVTRGTRSRPPSPIVAGSSCKTRRPSWSPPSPACSRATESSTPARRQAARRWRWRP